MKIIIVTIINKNAYISVLLLSTSGSRRAHISPEEDWNFSGKNCQKLGCFCVTKIRLGEMSSMKNL